MVVLLQLQFPSSSYHVGGLCTQYHISGWWAELAFTAAGSEGLESEARVRAGPLQHLVGGHFHLVYTDGLEQGGLTAVSGQ